MRGTRRSELATVLGHGCGFAAVDRKEKPTKVPIIGGKVRQLRHAIKRWA